MCTHIRDHHHYARDNVILCALCAAAYVREIGLRRTPCRGHGHIVSHLESLSLVGVRAPNKKPRKACATPGGD